MLLLVNLPDIWRRVFAAVQQDVTARESTAYNLKTLIADATTLSNPQVINAVAWGVTALVGFLLAVAVISFVGAIVEDGQNAAKQRGQNRFYLSRLFIRIVSIISIVWLGVLSGFVLVPKLAATFLQGVTQPLGAPQNIPLAVCAVVATGVVLYLFAVLFRLVTLRIRVFSTVAE